MVCIKQHPPFATHSTTSFRDLFSLQWLVHPCNEWAMQVFWKFKEFCGLPHSRMQIQYRIRLSNENTFLSHLKSLIPLACIYLLLTGHWWCFSLLRGWLFVFNMFLLKNSNTYNHQSGSFKHIKKLVSWKLSPLLVSWKTTQTRKT